MRQFFVEKSRRLFVTLSSIILQLWARRQKQKNLRFGKTSFKIKTIFSQNFRLSQKTQMNLLVTWKWNHLFFSTMGHFTLSKFCEWNCTCQKMQSPNLIKRGQALRTQFILYSLRKFEIYDFSYFKLPGKNDRLHLFDTSVKHIFLLESANETFLQEQPPAFKYLFAYPKKRSR